MPSPLKFSVLSIEGCFQTSCDPVPVLLNHVHKIDEDNVLHDFVSCFSIFFYNYNLLKLSLVIWNMGDNHDCAHLNTLALSNFRALTVLS